MKFFSIEHCVISLALFVAYFFFFSRNKKLCSATRKMSTLMMTTITETLCHKMFEKIKFILGKKLLRLGNDFLVKI